MPVVYKSYLLTEDPALRNLVYATATDVARFKILIFYYDIFAKSFILERNFNLILFSSNTVHKGSRCSNAVLLKTVLQFCFFRREFSVSFFYRSS